MAERVRDILRESMPLLLGMAVLEVLAGAFLGRMEHSLERLPGLLAMTPAVLALRGNVSTAMGSRLGTATRFGLIPRDKLWSPVVRENIIASIVQGLVLSVAAAVLAHFVTVWVGHESAGIGFLAIISVVAGLVSGVIMGGVAIVTMRVAFRRGLDLDNVAGPVLMTLSDVFTLICLWGTAELILGVA